MSETYKTVGKAYAVFSVRDLRKLLKRAVAGAKEDGPVSRKQVSNHCIVLNNVGLLDCGKSDGQLQFAAHRADILGVANE